MVGGQVAGIAHGKEYARIKAGTLQAADVQGGSSHRAGSKHGSGLQVQLFNRHCLRRPFILRHPPPQSTFQMRARLDALLHPHAHARLGHDAGVFAFQPVIPPAQALLHKANLRAGHGAHRVLVRPWANQRLAWCAQRSQQAQHRIAVAVGPAAHQIHRALDGGRVFADRAVLPVFVAPLVRQPRFNVWWRMLQPVEPHAAPALANKTRIWRARIVCQHRGSPARHVGGHQAAAPVVHIIRIAVICGGDADDRPQLRRPARCNLQPVEAAP